MKKQTLLATLSSALIIYGTGCSCCKPVKTDLTSQSGGHRSRKLFDGKTFAGWEGDTNKFWRIENGAFVGGTLKQKIPHNDFLCTTEQFSNFDLRLKFKLVGTGDFNNGGVQFRSQRVPNDPEVSGYQADMGDGWWGCLYDESRRNKVLVKPDPAVIEKAIKRNEWNDYEVRCEGDHIQIILNGATTVDYHETDPKIPQTGILGFQIHAGGPAEASYKDIVITPL